MEIFTNKFGHLTECNDDTPYYNAIVAGGEFTSDVGFYADVKVLSVGADEIRLKIKDESVYQKILTAYQARDWVGIVLE